MIGTFMAWWGARLGEWLPGRRGGVPADALIAVAGPPITLLLRRRRQERTLGALPPDPAALAARLRGAGIGRRPLVVLRLPAAALLERRITLPLAAEQAPAQVLGYEMDRFTPFASADVAWSFAVERRDPAQQTLALRLWLVPLATLRPPLAELARAGLAPALLEAAAPDGTPRLIGLRHAVPASPGQRRLRAAGVGLCAALTLAALALPFLRQQSALTATEREIAALRPDVAAAAALRRRLAGEAPGSDAIAGAQARLGDTLGVLAAVTSLLPDDTFLTELRLTQGHLSLDGQSANAARLIAALAASRALRNPTFAAPVTRAPTGPADLFSIHAEIVPGAAP